ncbi:hypothetical protein PSTT_10794 [Puccinia striiformis]|uniref:Uncharacterized protein n=1 Tax=Puccinia striiformis TaxID=27350 RepID=A0A2S4V2W4_9BASI|nr:hypothetical protein PSTT_10794 [Puccinia striiformis]
MDVLIWRRLLLTPISIFNAGLTRRRRQLKMPNIGQRLPKTLPGSNTGFDNSNVPNYTHGQFVSACK